MATPIPKNLARFTLDELLSITGGVLIPSNESHCTEVAGISTDTRSLAPEALFVAIIGSQFDGHDHLESAHRAGAKAALVERDCPPVAGLVQIRVPSSLKALGDLARAHARAWKTQNPSRKMICITGSAGKTTTRVALDALLRHLMPGAVHSTSGNLNNLIGMPMVLLNLKPEHRVAVIEIATNAPGEIAALSAIAEPDIGIITLIDAAHTLGLGSLEGVAREKGALFQALPPAGHAVGNAESPLVQVELQQSPAIHKYTYGFGEGCQARICARSLLGLTQQQLRIEIHSPKNKPNTIECTTPLLGEAGALACAAALLVAELVTGTPISSEDASLAFSKAEVGAGAGRLVPVVLPDGTLLIDDSYNANPASSAASIRAAAEIAQAEGRRLFLVLGEMRELGQESQKGHENVGKAAAQSGAAFVIAVAGDAALIAAQAKAQGIPARFAENAQAAADLAVELVRPGDVVLVKGSRSIGTERVARALTQIHTQNQSKTAQASSISTGGAAP